MINKNQECDIISDLLPLYLEEKTSEESGEFIKEHVEHCQECRKNLELMGASYEELFALDAETEEGKKQNIKKKSPNKRSRTGRKIFGKALGKVFLFVYLLLLLGIWIFIVTSFMEML